MVWNICIEVESELFDAGRGSWPVYSVSGAAGVSLITSMSLASASPGSSSTFSRKSLLTIKWIACERFETVIRTSFDSSYSSISIAMSAERKG
jgi:hypothetical protein